MLFRRVEVDGDIRRDLILSKLDYKNEETLHEKMETRLKEVLGGGLGTRKTCHRDGRGAECTRRSMPHGEGRQTGAARGEMGDKAERPRDEHENLMNRLGRDGKPLICFY